MVFLLLNSSYSKNIALRFLFVALYSSLPAFLQWSGAGTAEVWIVAFYFTMLYFSLQFMKSGELRDLALAFASAASISFTKNEGLPISIISLISLIFFTIPKDGTKKLGLFVVCGVFSFLALLPWIVWSYDIPRIHENYPAQIKNIFSMEHIGRMPGILKAFVLQFCSVSRWGIFWPLVLVACFLGFKKIETRFLICVLLANLALYIFIYIYIISPWDTGFLVASALERLLLHLSVPAAMIILIKT